MRAAATVVLAKRTPCAWKENTVLSIITFASATVALENDRSATKLPHLNSNATVHYHIVRKEGTVSWVKDRSSKKIVFFCGTTAVDDDGYDIASALLE